MIILRDYQKDLIQLIKNGWIKGIKHILVQLATGGGKTIIFSHIATETAKRGKKIFILSDRIELLKQSGGSIQNFGEAPYYIESGNKSIHDGHSIYIGMSQTCRRRLDKPYFIDFINSVDLVIIDECHKQEFNIFFESGLIKKDMYVLGFTATPERHGKMRQLALDYTLLVRGIKRTELIKRGYLVPDVYFAPSTIDTKNISRNSKGDYNESQMYKKYDTPELYAGVVDNWKKESPGLKTLVFCVNIAHTIKTCLEYNKAGIKAKYLVSKPSKPKLPKEDAKVADWTKYEMALEKYNLYLTTFKQYSGDRSGVLDEWKLDQFTCLINAGIFTTGYDNPFIQSIVLNRATLSRSLLLQMIGRGARICEQINKQDFILLDFGDNCKRLETYYTGDEEYSLIHEQKSGGGTPPMKECIKCEAIIHAGAMVCDFCGAVVVNEKELKEIELKQVNYSEVSFNEANISFNDAMKDDLYDVLEKIQKDRKYSQRWILHQLYVKGGLEKLEDYLKYKQYKQYYCDKVIQEIVYSDVKIF